MTSGAVVSRRIPYIPGALEIADRSAVTEFEALVDTGFTGALVVPASLIDAAVPPQGYTTLRLADGSTVSAPTYAGTLRIGTHTIAPVTVIAMGDEPIIGLRVITQFRVTIDFGNSITFER